MSGFRALFTKSAIGAALLFAGLSSTAAFAQASPSAHTYATRYDQLGRVTGTIAPDPDGAGALNFAAARTTFDARGLPIKVESGELASWQSDAIMPSAWTGFVVLSSAESTYDANWRKIKDVAKDSNGEIISVTQYSYDARGRLECTAVRMNPAGFGALPASACTPGTEGAFGPDRITKPIYDAANRIVQTRRAVGTADEQAESTIDYTPNGQKKFLIDANGNKAEMVYDSYDRLSRWSFPGLAQPTAYNLATQATALASAGSVSTTDYEQYTYDANGNRLTARKRDGSVLTFSYDNLNRPTVKVVPERAGLATTHTRDVYMGYDNRGLQLYARFDSASGEGVANSYDGFGRMVSTSLTMDGATRTLSYSRDKNGNRSQLGWMDGAVTAYGYDGLGRMNALYEGSLASNITMLAYGYNNRGMRSSQSGRFGQLSTFTTDSAGRLASIAHDVADTANDVTFGLDAYNPAAQVTQRSTSNDAYVWTGAVNVSRNYAVNGLNQYTSAGPATFSYDANGNLTGDGTNTYVYDVENRLVSATGASTASLRYDPLGRLYETGGTSGLTRFLHDGDELVAEFDGNTNALLRRYLHGVSVDDPVVAYEGSAFNQPRWLHTNHQGSIVAISDSSGAVTAKNTFDEWGIPGSSNASIAAGGRFSYTGQAWIPELGMYYYKARIYSPTLGRFMQTDPIGYDDQMNLYGYVGNDPVNFSDPDGLRQITSGERELLSSAFGFVTNLSDTEVTYDMALDAVQRATATSSGFRVPASKFSGDYSKDNASRKRLFYHEMYHVFEMRMGIKSWYSMAKEQAKETVSGNKDSMYGFDAKKSFWTNRFEARADYFGNCMTGGNDCSSLSRSSLNLDSSRKLKFDSQGKSFYIVTERTGSLVKIKEKLK